MKKGSNIEEKKGMGGSCQSEGDKRTKGPILLLASLAI